MIFLKKKRMKINQLWLCIYCQKQILPNMKNTTTSVSKRDLSLKLSPFLGIRKEKTNEKRKVKKLVYSWCHTYSAIIYWMFIE